MPPADKPRRKNPAAVALARLRAQKLTPERRQEIAQKAIAARWKRRTNPGKPAP